MSSQPVFNHQDFSIDSSKRSRVIRQERHYVGNGNHKVKIKDSIYDVENYSPFGIALKNASMIAADDQIIRAQYIINDITICDIDIKRIRNDELGFVGFSIEGQALPIEAIQAIEQSVKVIKEFENNKNKYSAVPQSFKDRAYEAKAWLEGLEVEVNKMTKSSFETPLKELKQHEEAVAYYVSQYLFKAMPKFAESMGISLSGVNQETLNTCYDFLRFELGNIFYKSSYGNRAYSKPRGYAGDYEMMNNVYHNDLRGDTLFGKCMQRYFTDNPAGRAVRNRVKYLNEKIIESSKKSNSTKILAVASGPAKEIQNLILENPEIAQKCEIHLLDQDSDALMSSQREIYELARIKKIKLNVHFHNVAIKNVINEGLPTNDFDLIYSAGLFDYFTDPVAQFAANRLFNSLKESGQLIIGNFSTNNPAQFIMEAIGDWYLIYRSEDQLIKLYSQVSRNIKIESEPEGVNLFAILRK